MCLSGLGLAARAAANEELGSLAKGKGFIVDRTLRIDAPVESVYEFWKNPENFAQWMSHVREVRRVAENRWHWSVDGPAGVPVEWNSEITQDRENRALSWRSVQGSTVDNGGSVRFEPDGNGTRVRIELHYSPPGGVIGQAVAKAFGTDPATEMNDDLQKLKARIESLAMRREPPSRGDSGLGAAPA